MMYSLVRAACSKKQEMELEAAELKILRSTDFLKIWPYHKNWGKLNKAANAEDYKLKETGKALKV